MGKVADRSTPIDDLKWAGKLTTLEAMAPMWRANVRCSQKNVEQAEENFEINLPKEPKKSVVKKNRGALWLGPDEWVIIDTNPKTKIKMKGDENEFYAVNVSHNFCTINVKGQGARMTLSASCPQDLRPDTFIKGDCSRTILGKATVIIHCINEQEFYLHCQRSFSEYVWELLRVSAEDVDTIE